jgi:hypothetical protein
MALRAFVSFVFFASFVVIIQRTKAHAASGVNPDPRRSWRARTSPAMTDWVGRRTALTQA